MSRRILVLAVNRRIVPLPNDRRSEVPETGTDQRTGRAKLKTRNWNRRIDHQPRSRRRRRSRLLHRNRKKPYHLTVSGNSSANGLPHHKARGVYSLWVQYNEASSRRADCQPRPLVAERDQRSRLQLRGGRAHPRFDFTTLSMGRAAFLHLQDCLKGNILAKA